MSSKRYPEEFKREAARQVTDRGYSVAQVASRLGVTTHSLYAWLKKDGPDAAEPQAKADDQAEIRRLQEELKRVTEERDILKKAAVDSIGQRNTSRFDAFVEEAVNGQVGETWTNRCAES